MREMRHTWQKWRNLRWQSLACAPFCQCVLGYLLCKQLYAIMAWSMVIMPYNKIWLPSHYMGEKLWTTGHSDATLRGSWITPEIRRWAQYNHLWPRIIFTLLLWLWRFAIKSNVHINPIPILILRIMTGDQSNFGPTMANYQCKQ